MAESPAAPATVADDVRRALSEDIGAGDLSAAAIPPAGQLAASVIARASGIACGRPWFDEAFRQVDPQVRIDWQIAEGRSLAAGATLCHVTGPARTILSAERTALNFLQLLSAVATATRGCVEAVRGTGVAILDTRKTLPGLRAAQKYAVACGGGSNHRMGLFDAAMLKENHIHAAGGIAEAIRALRGQHPQAALTVEVENLAELDQALAAGADRLLLDNFDLDTLAEAVRRTGGRAILEASGGITAGSIRAIAQTGIDCISIGALTKDIQAMDLSLRYA